MVVHTTALILIVHNLFLIPNHIPDDRVARFYLNTAEPGVILNRDTKIHRLSDSRVESEFVSRARRIERLCYETELEQGISIMTEPSCGPLLNLLTPCGCYQDRGEGYATSTPRPEATLLSPKRAMLE